MKGRSLTRQRTSRSGRTGTPVPSTHDRTGDGTQVTQQVTSTRSLVYYYRYKHLFRIVRERLQWRKQMIPPQAMTAY